MTLRSGIAHATSLRVDPGTISKKLRSGYREQRLLGFRVQGRIDVQRCIHDLQILECTLCRPRLRSEVPPTGKESAVAPLTPAGKEALAALRAQHRGRHETKGTRRTLARAVAAALTPLSRKEQRQVQRRLAEINASASSRARNRVNEARWMGLEDGLTITQNVGRGKRQR